MNDNVIENIIFIDHDDTLFPTTALTNEIVPIRKEFEWLKELDNFHEKLSILKKTKIILVTNASMEWIDTCKKNIKFNIIMHSYKYISARDTYMQNQYDVDGITWKLKTFTEQLSQYPDVKNIISIGDAVDEFVGIGFAYDRVDFTNMPFLKRIKLIGRPSIQTLTDQLVILRSALDSILNANNSIDWSFKNHTCFFKNEIRDDIYMTVKDPTEIFDHYYNRIEYTYDNQIKQIEQSEKPEQTKQQQQVESESTTEDDDADADFPTHLDFYYTKLDEKLEDNYCNSENFLDYTGFIYKPLPLALEDDIDVIQE